MCRGCVVLGAHGHPEREIMLFAVMYAMRDNNARDAKVLGSSRVLTCTMDKCSSCSGLQFAVFAYVCMLLC